MANLSSAVDGWYQDLVAGGGERVVKPLQAPLGVLIAFTITPSIDVCVPGASGTAYARTGYTGDNAIDPLGGVTYLGGTSGSAQYVGANLIRIKEGVGGSKLVVQVLDSDGKITTLDKIKFPSGFQGTVVNYREIIE